MTIDPEVRGTRRRAKYSRERKGSRKSLHARILAEENAAGKLFGSSTISVDE
jgi:hypothetical protein